MIHILFTDIHFGKHSNSKIYNEDCLNFLYFMKKYIKENLEGKEYQVNFLGDYYNERNSVNVSTLNYGTQGFEILNSIGCPVNIIVGNHDLFLRNSRDISSLNYAYKFNNLKIINEPLMIENNLYCSWLINDEKISNLIKQYNPEYIFGHFEIPSFKLTSYGEFPGIYNKDEYKGPKKIFSGHFHIQQDKDNIMYIGSCLCQDFNDVNQENYKGFIILDDVTGKYEFINYKNTPIYKRVKISELDDNFFNNKPNLYLQCIVDQNIDNDRLNEIRKGYIEKYHLRSMIYINEVETSIKYDNEIDITKFDSVEDMVIGYINEMDLGENYNKEKLVKLFNDN